MNMSVETLVTVEEYLNTSYDPDVEYVDGVLEERNGGDWLPSTVQSNVLFFLRTKYRNVYVRAELRSQTRATRFRLPDVCVLLTPLKTKYVLDAAYVAVEVLSEDDRMPHVIEKLEEYERKGVPNIWLIDPRLKKISVFSNGTLTEVRREIIATVGEPRLELTRAEVFQDLE